MIQKLTVMEGSVSERCLSIIDELLEHPISKVFQGGPPNQATLLTVKQKLRASEYPNVEAFKEDVERVWNIADLVTPKPSLVTYMAEELSRLFKKRMLFTEHTTQTEWTSKYLSIQKLLFSLFRNQPHPLDAENLTPDMEALVPDKKTARSWLLPEDIPVFETGFRLIEDPAHLERVIHILNENEPTVDTTEEDIYLNLSALNQRSLRMLKSLATEIRNSTHGSTATEGA